MYLKYLDRCKLAKQMASGSNIVRRARNRF